MIENIYLYLYLENKYKLCKLNHLMVHDIQTIETEDQITRVMSQTQESVVSDSYELLLNEERNSEEDLLSESTSDTSMNLIHLSENQLLELEEEIFILIETFIADHPCYFSNEKYEDIILENVTVNAFNVALSYVEDITTINEEIFFGEIQEYVEERVDIYIHTILSSPRQVLDQEIYQGFRPSIEDIQQRLLYLASLPQPQQRTPEWYEFRYNKMTATHIGKLLSSNSEANFNRVIYEKCKPFHTEDDSNINITSPMHWGVKYEPVTLAIYEKQFSTKVGEFGCIAHDKYDCIGASPDGINNDMANLERFGRMVEIKNVVSRKITGIPITPYWIQTQIQMEVCNLEECDFVETKFVEFEEFHQIYTEKLDIQKGVILHFRRHTGEGNDEPTMEDQRSGMKQIKSGMHDSKTPFYVYMPLTIPIEQASISTWTKEQIVHMANNGYVLHAQIAWYLEVFSCVLIPRNRPWFDSVVPKILETWEIIVKERQTGYQHRIAKKKSHGPLVVFQLDNTD